MHNFLKKLAQRLVNFQTRFAWSILILGLFLSIFCAPSALKLLTNVRTELNNLLPEDYPSVLLSPYIQKVFNRRSNLVVVIHSPDRVANEKAMLDAYQYLMTNPDIETIDYQKQGYDFLDAHKLLLLDLKDLYSIHDRLKDKIQKRKLGGLYIDFESDDASKKDDVSFDDFVQKYEDQYSQGVQNRYYSNKDGTTYVLKIYPKTRDSGIKFFKTYRIRIANYLAQGFDFKKYHPEMTYGFSGTMVSRVDQYEALMRDLSRAGLISLVSIFLALFIYFAKFTKRFPGVWGFFKTQLVRAVPVVVVFVPMIYSTLYAFSFCHLLIKQLNIVTSFLFAIIFGLGVDIGIHLISRYIHDMRSGYSFEMSRWCVMSKTGVTCIISVLTTVATFYILIVNDFRGFSEFGWIAGNGLIIALITYMIFTPCLIALVHRYKIMPLKELKLTHEEIVLRGQRWLPRPKLLLAIFATLTLLAVVGAKNLSFEWNFNKVKMVIPKSEYWRSLMGETTGRINSPSTYLVQNGVQAAKLRQLLRETRDTKKEIPTIEWFRSSYDLVPSDQEEKIAILADVRKMLSDDALNAVNEEERKLIDIFKKEIDKTKPITAAGVTSDVTKIFWGPDNPTQVSAAFVMPLADLDLDDGKYAKEFYKDVAKLKAFGQTFYCTSDAIVFADVMQTLFKDSRIAVSLCMLVITLLIVFHFRNTKRTLIVLCGLGGGIVWMLGFMDLFSLKLNFYNMIVIPAMIGMGEDNSVHMVDRFDEFGHKSILHVLKTTGGAAFMASLTTILGYSGMCFTTHPGLRSIGMASVLGMTMCLVSSLVLVPILLQLFIRGEKT